MKTIVAVIGLVLFTPLGFCQGTVVFHNRGLTGLVPGTIYNAPINGFCPGAKAQLYLVTGEGASAVYTPLFPRQIFRPAPNHQYFIEPLTVIVDGHPAGTTGLRFVVRVWTETETFEEAMPTPDGPSFKGESAMIAVHEPLGGMLASGEKIPPPDLGGPDGFQSFTMAAGVTPGRIEFHNRDLTAVGGGTYNVPINVIDPKTARAQLYLVSGAGASTGYTPLYPVQTFGAPPNHQFFAAPLAVDVHCHLAGATGVQFVVRYWEKANSYEEALKSPSGVYGQSDIITVEAPLGSESTAPPDLGGVNGWKSFPSTFLRFTAAAAEGDLLRFEVFANFGLEPEIYILDASSDFQNWSPVLTNQGTGQQALTVPKHPDSMDARYFRLRRP